MNKSHFLTVFSDEKLRMSKPLSVKTLIVHLGTPGPTIDTAGYDLQYGDIELHGSGQFRILNGGVQITRFAR